MAPAAISHGSEGTPWITMVHPNRFDVSWAIFRVISNLEIFFQEGWRMDEDYFDSVTSIVKLVDPWVAIAGGYGSTITSHLWMKNYLGNDEPSR